jgi:hypothetical protein
LKRYYEGVKKNLDKADKNLPRFLNNPSGAFKFIG